jgi:hypothetical protein
MAPPVTTELTKNVIVAFPMLFALNPAGSR